MNSNREHSARVAEAAAGQTSEDRLAELKSDPSDVVREAIARREDLPLSFVEQLKDDPAWQVRFALVKGSRADRLRQLIVATSRDSKTRALLAEVRSLEAEVGLVLANDPASEVPERLAKVTRDRELFDILLRDRRPRVRAMCAWNEKLITEDDIEVLLEDPSWIARAALVHRSELTGDQLAVLARDRSAQVQWQVVVRREATPRSILEIVAAEGDPSNSAQARQRIDENTNLLESAGQ